LDVAGGEFDISLYSASSNGTDSGAVHALNHVLSCSFPIPISIAHLHQKHSVMSACTLVLQATIEAKFGKEEQLKWIQDVYGKGFSGTELSPPISDTYLHF
jgi:hypothetical protein